MSYSHISMEKQKVLNNMVRRKHNFCLVVVKSKKNIEIQSDNQKPKNTKL